MSGSVVILHLAGAVALMLFATQIIKTSVERAFGKVLRLRLRATMGKPLAAVLAGTGLAIAFQSSTAVTLLVGSFAGSGLVSGAAGQLAVRGAEVGSALVTKLLTFNLTLLVPICLLAGTFMFMATEQRNWRQIGRIVVGVGLLVLSLEMIGQASEPLRDSELMPLVIDYFSGDPASAFLLAAIITWLFQSSIAAVLLMATFAARGLITPELGIVLVLGVNLGSSVIAPMLTRGADPKVRVVPIGNLLMRGAGSLVMLTLFLSLRPPVSMLGSTVAGQIVNGHILFNVLILLAGLPLSRLVYRASEWLVLLSTKPQAAAALSQTEVSALDEAALDTPSLALANATREVVGVCETVEVMLQRIIELYQKADTAGIEELAALDDRVDRRHAAIKLYLAKATLRPMSEEQAHRCQELLGACVKLEQVGDIIVRNMLAQVRKKMERGLEFTPEGWRELEEFHAAVLANARLAFNVLVSRDPETAHQLVREKERLRERERDASQNHFIRLRQGTAKSLETSSIHLDTIRDLKEINSLLAAIAYPVLEEQGMLRDSRLVAV